MNSGTGTCTVTFNQAGDGSNYAAAPQVSESTTAQPAGQTISVTQEPPASATFGDTLPSVTPSRCPPRPPPGSTCRLTPRVAAVAAAPFRS
jgi:hypothetical protein